MYSLQSNECPDRSDIPHSPERHPSRRLDFSAQNKKARRVRRRASIWLRGLATVTPTYSPISWSPFVPDEPLGGEANHEARPTASRWFDRGSRPARSAAGGAGTSPRASAAASGDPREMRRLLRRPAGRSSTLHGGAVRALALPDGPKPVLHQEGQPGAPPEKSSIEAGIFRTGQ